MPCWALHHLQPPPHCVLQIRRTRCFGWNPTVPPEDSAQTLAGRQWDHLKWDLSFLLRRGYLMHFYDLIKRCYIMVFGLPGLPPSLSLSLSLSDISSCIGQTCELGHWSAHQAPARRRGVSRPHGVDPGTVTVDPVFVVAVVLSYVSILG